jgi:hypothetical protein
VGVLVEIRHQPDGLSRPRRLPVFRPFRVDRLEVYADVRFGDFRLPDLGEGVEDGVVVYIIREVLRAAVSGRVRIARNGLEQDVVVVPQMLDVDVVISKRRVLKPLLELRPPILLLVFRDDFTDGLLDALWRIAVPDTPIWFWDGDIDGFNSCGWTQLHRAFANPSSMRFLWSSCACTLCRSPMVAHAASMSAQQ